MNANDWMGIENEWRHALVDPALARLAAGDASPAAEATAYRAASALGRARLFAVALGDWDGVLNPTLARAAARHLTLVLQRLRARADALPKFWDEAGDDVEAREKCLSLLEARMEAWAVCVALDEAQLDALVHSRDGRDELVTDYRQAQGELAPTDEALVRQTDFLSIAAGTELLGNWRRLLDEQYRIALPWWLDGSLEETATRLWKQLPAGRISSQLDDHPMQNLEPSMSLVTALDEYQLPFAQDSRRALRLLAPAGSGKSLSLLFICINHWQAAYKS
jgi:hypothetical protein